MTFLIKLSKDIQGVFDCDKKEFPIKIWEGLLFIFLCFSTEILDLFSYPKSFAEVFKTFPLNTNLFWIILLKAAIGQVVCIYLTIRYYEKKLTTQIWLFWILQSMIPTINHLGKNISIIKNIAPFATILIWMGFFIYFFAIDSCHINSIKIFLYNDVIVDQETGQVHKTPNSRISKTKLKKTATYVATMLLCSFILTNLFKKLIELLLGQPKDETGSSEPKNQQEIVQKAKENFFIIAISTIIMAPVIEEWMFRRFLMKTGKFKWWTVMLSGFLFGLAHLKTKENPIHLVGYTIPGLTLGMGMWMSRNIWHTIYAHALHNAIVIIIMMFTQL